jgi:hypothetical protein
MSSSVLPTLNIDVSHRRGDRTLVAAALLCAIAAMVLWQEVGANGAISSLCVVAGIGAAFRSLGWLGGRFRISRVVVQGDGQWLLCDRDGRTTERTLAGSSRVTSRLIWLQWQGMPLRPILLVPGDIPADDFRRLVVRLRLGDNWKSKEAVHEV